MGWLANVTRPLARLLAQKKMDVPGDMTYRDAYALMWSYYLNNDLYRLVGQALREDGYWGPALREMRNPTFAAVEFYAMTLMPGTLPDALPIVTENEAIIEPIHQVWKWSNFGSRKQAAVRKFACLGDLFFQVATRADENGQIERVYIVPKDPRNVTDFRVDEQGYVTALRWEVSEEDDSGKWVRTEIWDREQVRVWRHQNGFDASEERLGRPDRELSYSLQERLGVDFVPWVHAPFRDIGDARGLPLVWPVLSKIDELNMKCTRLSQLLYPGAKWALQANAMDKDGRPLPAPQLKSRGSEVDSDQTFTVRGEDVWMLPGNATLTPLVPDLNFDAHLRAIESDYAEIKRDLPEAHYYEMLEKGDVSGRALAHMMAPAISRVLESRGNLEHALSRANQMALTIGKLAKLDGFTAVDDFDKGDLEHRFADRDVLPESKYDKADLAKVYVEMGVSLGTSLEKYAGWSETDAEAEEGKAKEKAAAVAQVAARSAPRTQEEAAPLFQGVVRTPDIAGRVAESGAIGRAVARGRN